MDIIDLCRIIGILFDNAIEETENLEEKRRKIKFAVIKKKKSVIIVIENNCKSEICEVYKLFEEGFSTKGEGRGLGLSMVRNIIMYY